MGEYIYIFVVVKNGSLVNYLLYINTKGRHYDRVFTRNMILLYGFL